MSSITQFIVLITAGIVLSYECAAAQPDPAVVRIKVCQAPGSVEIADFNRDRISDLVIASETDSSITILLGDGKGGFREANHSPFFAGHIPNDLCLVDLNRDGTVDLAIANHERKYLTVLRGTQNATFTPFIGSPFAVIGLPHTHGVAAGDFDGDGWIDLATDSWGNDKVEVLYGDSENHYKRGAMFKVGRRPYQRLRSADINHDGLTDLVTTNAESNNATVLLGSNAGFQEAIGSPFACGDAPFGLAIADVNADGKLDLAIINSPGSMAEGKGKNGLTVLLGNGKGGFMTMKGCPLPAGKIPNRVAAGDINGDGVNDIVSSDNDGQKIYVFVMSKQGLHSTYTVEVGNHPKGVAIGDLNGDGKADIVVCNNGDNDISIVMSVK